MVRFQTLNHIFRTTTARSSNILRTLDKGTNDAINIEGCRSFPRTVLILTNTYTTSKRSFSLHDTTPKLAVACQLRSCIRSS